MTDEVDKFFQELLGAQGLDVAVIEEIQAAGRVSKYDARSTIITQENSDNDVFYLLSGKATAVIYSSEGHEIWLGDYQQGDFFGEMAALTGEGRSASVVARTEVTVAVFSAEDFLNLMRRHGAFGTGVARSLAVRARHSAQRMFELSTLSVSGRVYAELLREAKPIVAGGASGNAIQPAPSLAELARRVNSTRESVSRTISDLERKGVVQRRDDIIVVLTPDEIALLASRR